MILTVTRADGVRVTLCIKHVVSIAEVGDPNFPDAKSTVSLSNGKELFLKESRSELLNAHIINKWNV